MQVGHWKGSIRTRCKGRYTDSMWGERTVLNFSIFQVASKEEKAHKANKPNRHPLLRKCLAVALASRGKSLLAVGRSLTKRNGHRQQFLLKVFGPIVCIGSGLPTATPAGWRYAHRAISSNLKNSKGLASGTCRSFNAE